jgi:flagellar hook assembly protein FlgD
MFKAGRITETNTVRVTVDSLSDEIDIIVNLTLSDLADGVVLNYPNPFGLESETTHFDYYLPEDADVTLRVFDLFGNLVWTKEISAGQEGARGRDRSTHPNSVEWNGQNDRGQKIGNGGYVLLARATANGKVVMNHKRKIVVLR